MKRLRTGLKKTEIAPTKTGMKSYRIINDDLILFVDEMETNSEGNLSNKIDWKSSVGTVGIGNLDFTDDFYEKNKALTPKVYIKADYSILYNEFKVDSWEVNGNSINVVFSK